MMGIRLQDWPYIETALSKYNQIIKSSIYTFNRANQTAQTAPISAPFYPRNEWISADMYCFQNEN